MLLSNSLREITGTKVFCISMLELIYLLLHNVVHEQHLTKILIQILEVIIEKISYDRRVYESVHDKSLSRVITQKSTDNRIHATKG